MSSVSPEHISLEPDQSDGPDPAPRSMRRSLRWNQPGVLVLMVIIAGIVGALINEWVSGRLPGGWRFEVLLGILLLAGAAAFATILLARTWHDLDSAKRLLTDATGNLSDAYDALLETNKALSETASARDRALNHLQNAIREREAFLASVSHDLKSPLTIIKGHADILTRHVRTTGAPNPDRLTDGLDRIVTSAANISSMVDELLWLARLEMDEQVDLDRKPTDLIALAKSAVADYAGTTARHTITIVTELPQVTGWWDRRRLERIVANLLSNAIKYSPDGGDIDVEITVDETGSKAVLAVSDRGVGIPEADLPHIFERFYRADNVDSLVAGTGVGLSGVRHAVEAHGGSITAERRNGGGSTFRIELPIGEPVAIDDVLADALAS